MEFPSVFWDASLSYFGAALPGGPEARGAAFMFWNLQPLTAANQLTALVSGAASFRGESLPREMLIEDALRVLRTLFGEDKVPKPLGVTVTAWMSEEFSKGDKPLNPRSTSACRSKDEGVVVTQRLAAKEETHRTDVFLHVC